jgi:formate dehydrogenase subunit gamma
MHADKIIELASREIGSLRSFLGPEAPAQGALLPLLHAIQEKAGCIAPDDIPIIAEELNISQAEVRGVVSFYHDFRLEVPARHTLKLCRAEACQSLGSERLADYLASKHKLEPGRPQADGSLTIESVYCLGNCGLGPAALLDDRLLGRLDETRLDTIIEGARR